MRILPRCWSRAIVPGIFCLLMLAPAACSGPASTSDGLNGTATGTPAATADSNPPVVTQATVMEPPTGNPTPTNEQPADPADTATSEPLDTPTPGPEGSPDEPTATQATPADSPTTEPTATTPPVVSNPDPLNASIQVQQVASGFLEPTLLTHAGDGSGTIYVTQKSGSIRTLDGSLFMDITDRVINTGLGGNDRELGLLGLAFHPDFETNGYFYVHYNDPNLNSVISRFEVNPGGTGNPASEQVLLTARQSEGHFNGGTILFGPDGYLYIAFGTGGNLPGDHANSQDLGSIFGKILRIDVDNGDPYAIPADNPFLDVAGARGEVWVYGLRNPWRFAFDTATGDVYIAEPGQFGFEWVHFQAAGPNGAPPGDVNFGWPVYEGFHCFDIETETASDPSNCSPPSGYQPPILEYPRGQNGGCVIIGGDVYRGAAIPELQGAYLYSDFCSATVYTAWRDQGGQWQTAQVADLGGLISSFGVDESGELYILDIGQGLIHKIIPG